jgi:hypothetical protein
MLILTGSDDPATRLAAGGALAIITESPDACNNLLKEQEKSVWSRVLAFMEYQEEDEDEDGTSIPVISSQPPDEPSIQRAAVILYNLVGHVNELNEAAQKEELGRIQEAGVQDALMRVLRSQVDRETLEPVVECLKLMKRLNA